MIYGWFVFFFFFFKQKTSYDMRISDWSSDVCSSDLVFGTPLFVGVRTDWLFGAEGRHKNRRRRNALIHQGARDRQRALGREVPIIGKLPIALVYRLIIGKPTDPQNLHLGLTVIANRSAPRLQSFAHLEL